MTVRRDDPPGLPEHQLDPPVPVEVTVDAGVFPGLAERWRGRWVYCRWSEDVGLQHLEWVLAEQVRRITAQD